MVIPPDAYEAIAVLTLPVMAMMVHCMVKLGRSHIGQAPRPLPPAWSDTPDAGIATPV